MPNLLEVDLEPYQVAARIVRANRYLSLGTSNFWGSWVSPIAYTIEPDFSLVYYSALAAKHSKNIRWNRVISGAIFNSTEPSSIVDGVQFSAVASIVGKDEIEGVMERYFTRSFPEPIERQKWERPKKDFLGPAPQRFYRLALTKVWKPDPESSKIDRRIELNLDLLFKALKELE